MSRCPKCPPGFATMAKDDPEDRWCGVREGDKAGKGGKEHGYW